MHPEFTCGASLLLHTPYNKTHNDESYIKMKPRINQPKNSLLTTM